MVKVVSGPSSFCFIFLSLFLRLLSLQRRLIIKTECMLSMTHFWNVWTMLLSFKSTVILKYSGQFYHALSQVIEMLDTWTAILFFLTKKQVASHTPTLIFFRFVNLHPQDVNPPDIQICRHNLSAENWGWISLFQLKKWIQMGACPQMLWLSRWLSYGAAVTMSIVETLLIGPDLARRCHAPGLLYLCAYRWGTRVNCSKISSPGNGE